MCERFYGKRAIVTGASRGIGRGIAEALSKEGAKVWNLDLNNVDIPGIITVQVDLRDQSAVEKVFNEIGEIDYLVNNAGILPPKTSFLDTSKDTLADVIDTNLKAPMFISQIVVRYMIEKGNGGSIVNIASIVALQPMKYLGAYGISKAGLSMMTKVMALELGQHKIRVNSVCPTAVSTELSKPFLEDPTFFDPLMARLPLGRIGQIPDVASAVLFLLSDDASMITGSDLTVDGGASRGIGREIAEALSKEGAKVWNLDLNNVAVEKVLNEIGEVDYLVNNAGISPPQTSFLDISKDTLADVIDTNLKAPMFISQIVVRYMIKKGNGGSIVNIASTIGLRPMKYLGAYGISKAGLSMMTRVMALELGQHKIRVNTVCPTSVVTELSKPFLDDPTFFDPLMARHPLRKIGQITDVASAVLFLLSDDASVITGSDLPVDGVCDIDNETISKLNFLF
ncbi:hypothetical protein KUTeg_018953 [Tegillarca granosa]|uniref:Uncharacterized protein n=1 Tax=Tegillarca granosa TaxID=220873 RepID=A0ABQ9EB49_TEGGR|nr:hypothetical protein KUTeg_018953 [Tegillarca granosa]